MIERIDPSQVPTDELVEHVAQRRRLMASVEAECITFIAEMLRRGAHELVGYRSATSYLVDRLGVSGRVARGMIRMARVLAHMPETNRALAAGEIDLARARLLATARDTNPDIFADHEPALVAAVRDNPICDSIRVVDYWRQQAAPEFLEEDAATVRERRRLHISPVAGMVCIDGLLDPVAGQVVITALDSLTDPGNLDPDDHRTPAQRRADALTDLCGDHLDHGDLPTQGKERPHVLVHLSIDALEGRAGRLCELDDAGVITPGAARRLACDAKISRIITDGRSEILDVGRTTRTVPAGMRRAVVARDRHCVIPGCRAPARWCDAHHIIHWADLGPTALWNLALLCTRHHTLLHEGKISIPQDVLDTIRGTATRSPPQKIAV
jgi:hypothetical protein